MIEAFLHHAGAADWDRMRIDYALLKHNEWYKGDAWYGDGANFHFDYYNSFVIQPMLVDVLREVRSEDAEWESLAQEALPRLARYATYQEHLISPQGTYPLIGRSLTYRFGAFHALAAAALNHQLENSLQPAQVRCAMTAVLHRLMSFNNQFDQNRWLKVGICGHQPGMGETYISTGSLYLYTAGFLPLGLAPEDPFWSDADTEWSALSLWSGQNSQCEHAL